MYKKITIIMMVLFCTFFLVEPQYVFAEDSRVVYKLDDLDCTGDDSIFGDPNDSSSVAYFLQQIFTVIKYAGPVLCVVLCVVDFVKAAASQDKDALAKSTKIAGKRIVYALILFFIPTLINFIFPLLGWYGTCGIS